VGLPDALGLERLNAAPAAEARAALLACCSSPAWAERMLADRPFADADAVYDAADAALAGLSESDLDAALAGHPRIGEKPAGEGSAWSRAEQYGVESASSSTADALARGNRDYEAKFGHVYLVCASGRSAEELLAILQQRLGNDAATERAVLRSELAQINRNRLARLLEPAVGAHA
jgi:2-oxo-4-hydroxy-4-carboxy-5-ureidoimidazoline decarboxylase